MTDEQQGKVDKKSDSSSSWESHPIEIDTQRMPIIQKKNSVDYSPKKNSQNSFMFPGLEMQ